MYRSETLTPNIQALSTLLDPRPTRMRPQTAPLAGIRAVLFDIYGTLVISASGDIGLGGEHNEEEAFRQALAAADLAVTNHDCGLSGPDLLKQTIRAFHAERKTAGIEYPEVEIRQIWRNCLARLLDLDPAALEQGLIERVAVEYECRVNPVWPMPGLAATLSALRNRGLVLGIVSNAQFYTPLLFNAFLNHSLEELGFDLRSSAFSFRLLEAKPSTRIYEEPLANLRLDHGIEPDQVLYVGNDMRNDIWPAQRCGCRTALFAGDERSLRLRDDDPKIAGTKPDRMITELRQITDSILM